MPKPLVIFEDTHVLVVSKPAGYLSQGDHSGDLSMVDWVRDYVGRHYVGLIHRLDRNVSGIMLIAKRTKAARRLTQSLQQGKISRVYRGFILGKLSIPKVWKHSLLKDTEKNKTKVLTGKDVSKGQKAVMKVEPLETAKWGRRNLTFVEFHLETGRSHQIRVQCAASGYPLLGDSKYGQGRHGNTHQKPFKRPALHAFFIRFPHPMTEEIMEFEAPLPADFKNVFLNA